MGSEEVTKNVNDVLVGRIRERDQLLADIRETLEKDGYNVDYILERSVKRLVVVQKDLLDAANYLGRIEEFVDGGD